MNDGFQRDAQSGGAGSPPNPSDAEAALVHELAEVHTALGNYLQAMKLLVESGHSPSDEGLREVIEQSIGQSERADKVFQQLRNLSVRRRTAKT
jgi:hypothetical protein